MPPDETECRNCGAFVVDEALVRLCRAFGIDRHKALQLIDAGFRHPLQLKGRDVDAVLEGHESGLLFLCTNCGSFVAGPDPACARCGAEFEAGPREPLVTPEDDILDLFICSNCGADNEPEARECDICGHAMPDGGRAPRTREGLLVSAAVTAEPGLEDEETLAEFDALAAELEAFETETRENESITAREGRTRDPHEATTPRQGSRTEAAVSTTPSKGPAVRSPPLRSADIEFRRLERARPLRRATWFRALPRDLLGCGITATAVGAVASAALAQRPILWVLAGILGCLAAYALTEAFPFTRFRRKPLEGAAVFGGSALAVAAPLAGMIGFAESATMVVSIASVAPLGWTLHRLWRGRYRATVAAVGSATMGALAVAAAQGTPFAGSSAWSVGFLLAAVWPAAIALDELRRRWSSGAIQDEVRRAERHYIRRELDRSIEDFDRAIRLSAKAAPRYDLPWYGKGAALTIAGKYEEALRAIDHALDLNPMNEVAWVNKGNALTRMGRLVDALRSFNAAIKVNPGYEVAWNNKGNAVARLGQFEEALRCYEKALELDPTYQGAWVNKGYVLTKLGRFDEAAACADRALELSGPAASLDASASGA